MKTKPLFITSCFIIFAIIFVKSLAFAQGSNTTKVDLSRMVKQIESLFPYLEGYVLSVDGDILTIDLHQGQNINPKDQLKVIRYGKPLTHPVTKKVIGKKEIDIGQVEILEIRRDYSLAKVLSSKQSPLKGDVVRSQFKKIKILVAPIQSQMDENVNTKGLVIEIESLLDQSSRLQALPFDLELWMLENGIGLQNLEQPGVLAQLKRETNPDYILFSNLEKIKNKASLTYKLISTEDGTIAKQSKVLTDIPKDFEPTPKRDQSVQTDLKAKDKFFKFLAKQEFDFELVDMDSGDLNGDGKKEFVFIDDHRVMIYAFEKNRFRKIGQKVFQSTINNFLSVDVADINKNGRAEIFVTNDISERLSSFVLEILPGQSKLSMIWEEVNLYFRVLRTLDTPPKLIAQKPSMDGPFKKGLFFVKNRSKKFTLERELSLPKIRGVDFNVYGLNLSNLDPKPGPEIIMLDKDYKLRVYSSRGRLLVKSDEYFGHDPRMIDVAIKDQVDGTFNHPDEPQPVGFKGRILLARHQDQKFLLLPKNHRFGGSLLSNLVVINNCSLVVLSVNPDGLERIHETKKQKGYLAAFLLQNSKNSKKLHLASVSDAGGIFKGKKLTTIFTYLW